jgi:hypothetical protein
MTFLHRVLLAAAAAAAVLAPGAALAHELFDHNAPNLGGAPAPTTSGTQMGPDSAQWEWVESIATGNPHTDLDYFTRNGETYLAAGTLGVAPNGGGQTIVKLTEGGEVAPELVSQAPTASCIANEAAALGLQHDVEASPKGAQLLNTFNPFAPNQEAQIIVDATDAQGRCHDAENFGGDGVLGLITDKMGGLEIIDVTDPENPVEIGLTSHIGEAHTVNIDPKRPHIAYAVTSDSTSVNATTGRRANETSTSALDLDGFEVVDMSTCMNFAPDTPVAQKRSQCNPEVFRYRWPTVEMAQGHTNRGTFYGCHELEVYPNDRLTCASGQALLVFDMTGAFNDMGTPDDYTDDKPRGVPLPCKDRASVSSAFPTGAHVTDCVDGIPEGDTDLIVSNWLKNGAPSLAGVEHVGTVFHMGRESAQGAVTPDYDSTEDIDFNHESELSQSGNLLIATDERGGGVLPPGASCSQANDIGAGNGGVHFYRADKLQKTTPTVRNENGTINAPASAEIAHQAYARTPEGEKAIFRSPVRTGGQAIICTAHVFHQIPGQNRIFIAWYSQGTHVVDFTENADGSVSLEEVGYFIPPNANEWVSQVFKAQENPDGTFTYWGAALDFNIGERGRNSIDIYKVTLPPPPKPADGPGVLPQRIKGQPVRDPQTGQTVIANTQAGAPGCVSANSIRSASVRRNGRRLSFAFRADSPVQIDLFRQAIGRRITGERLVRRFRRVSGTVRWSGRDRDGRRLRDGYYLVRFLASTSSVGVADERRFALRRRNGRFTVLGRHERQDTCGLLRRWKLFRPIFGGTTNRPLVMSFRVGSEARASIVVRRAGGRVVRRFAERTYRPGVLYRKRIGGRHARRLRRGQYTATILVRQGSRVVTSRLTATKV